jgi:hypothetical protein
MSRVLKTKEKQTKEQMTHKRALGSKIKENEKTKDPEKSKGSNKITKAGARKENWPQYVTQMPLSSCDL